ncbi:MAG: hypothetical protein ABJQ34_19045 [Paracoccaceae bacterium]
MTYLNETETGALRGDLVLLDRAFVKMHDADLVAIGLLPNEAATRTVLMAVLLKEFGEGVITPAGLYARFERGIYIFLHANGSLAALLPGPQNCEKEPAHFRFHNELKEILGRFAKHDMSLSLGV